MNLDTKLTATDVTGAKSLANSTSLRPESNGRRPIPGTGQKKQETQLELYVAYPSNPRYIRIKQCRLLEWHLRERCLPCRIRKDVTSSGLNGGPGPGAGGLLLGRRLQTGQVPGQTRQRALHFALADNEAAPRRVQVPRARAVRRAVSS